MDKSKNFPIRCPVCKSSNVGRIGGERFFCPHCPVEFIDKGDIFTIGEDGSLTKLVI